MPKIFLRKTRKLAGGMTQVGRAPAQQAQGLEFKPQHCKQFLFF
jgi:hypothetical protein